jgi:hypothetical protein
MKKTASKPATKTRIKRDDAQPDTASTSKTCPSGVVIPRRFTNAGEDVLAKVKYARRGTKITNPDGSIVWRRSPRRMEPARH